MLEAKLRDVTKRGRVLRNSGLVTGTIKRKSGEVVPISMVGYILETYILRNGLVRSLVIKLEDEKLNVKIDRVQRDVTVHNVINIDTIEL